LALRKSTVHNGTVSVDSPDASIQLVSSHPIGHLIGRIIGRIGDIIGRIGDIIGRIISRLIV